MTSSYKEIRQAFKKYPVAPAYIGGSCSYGNTGGNSDWKTLHSDKIIITKVMSVCFLCLFKYIVCKGKAMF